MGKPAFKDLIDLLKSTTGFGDSRKISAEEKLLILINVLKGSTNRTTKALFQHSGSTISLVLHDIVDRFMSIQKHFFRQPLPGDPVSSRIGSTGKFYPWFEHCTGAEDGSHIDVKVNSKETESFRDRKGNVTQNVFAACDFRMLFTFVHAGWEGSAHDMRVKDDAVRNGYLQREGKYTLGDAGISLSPYCLNPYRAVRYHLRESARSGLRPENFKELFNLRHAMLRNVIERVFGVLKMRFPILNNMQAYDFAFQVKLVMICFMLHNFIRTTETYEDCYWREADHNIEREAAQNEAAVGGGNPAPGIDNIGPSDNANVRALNAWRDNIAKSMWTDYLHHRPN